MGDVQITTVTAKPPLYSLFDSDVHNAFKKESSDDDPLMQQQAATTAAHDRLVKTGARRNWR